MTKRAPVARGPVAAETAATNTGAGWIGVALVTATGALSALLETLLVPLYVGTVVFPIAVVLAVLSNAVLPRLARSLVSRTAAAVAPFVAWLVVVIGFGAFARPEGDVILPGGGPGGVVLVTYGVMLGGALSGALTLVVMSNARPPSTAVSRQQGGNRRLTG